MFFLCNFNLQKENARDLYIAAALYSLTSTVTAVTSTADTKNLLSYYKRRIQKRARL